jgi:release factor glutamine methyltransferase
LTAPDFDAVTARLRAAGCVFAEDEAELLISAARDPVELEAMVRRRVDGQPLEHVVGFAEFCGLRILVDPGVFVPRRRSEFLVERAAELTPAGGIAVDLCCGSGALGLALAATVELAELHGVEIDPAAVRCARRNAVAQSAAPATTQTSGAARTPQTPAGLRVYLGDLYGVLPDSLRGRIDVLLANVPYVPTREVPLLPAEAREHEAEVALNGGVDGLDVLRRVAGGAAGWLAPGGHLLIEISERQVPAAEAAFASAGLRPTVVSSEELGATVIVGACPA